MAAKKARTKARSKEKEPTNDGAAYLKIFLKDSELSYSEFGERVSCTKAHVCGLVTRKSRPSGELAARMDAYSQGKIPQGSWFAASARR